MQTVGLTCDFRIALLYLTCVILPGRLIFVKNCGIDPERRIEMRDALDHESQSTNLQHMTTSPLTTPPLLRRQPH